ncbi:MAG: hypothetical protein JWP08_1088, partial [Bryobacterales bacterium]|nr:hypothetical protein [Bryobacterales bacterium]
YQPGDYRFLRLVQSEAQPVTVLATALRLLSGTLALASVAHADSLVTACSTDTQSGAGRNLAQALQAGGSIRFSCPPNTSIRITQGNVLRKDTVIDGEDKVTLDGHGLRAVLLNSVAQSVVLRRLTIRGMAQPPAPTADPGFVTLGRLRGSVLTAPNAELDHVTIETSEHPVVIRARLVVANSNFIGNTGSVLSSSGDARIKRSRFTGNESAVFLSAGEIDICAFTDHTRTVVRVAAPTAPVTIMHSVFGNTRGGSAIELSQRAARTAGIVVTIRANRFDGNDGGAQSGAIRLYDVAQEARDRGQAERIIKVLTALPPAGFELAYNRFNNNRGARGGAADFDLRNTAGMNSTGDLFVGNTAGEGGAVVQTGGVLQMSHALFRGNRALSGPGAAILASPASKLTLANALIAENVGPAGAIVAPRIALANVTVANNDATGLVLVGGVSSAVNSIFADNRPADCSGVPVGVFTGSNLQSATSCTGAATGNAFLDTLYIPALGSPALGLGDPAVCAAAPVNGSDMPFVGRGQRKCALGAYERAPLRHLPRAERERERPQAEPEKPWADTDGLGTLVAPPDKSPPYAKPPRRAR